jgi:hypothetical protein
MQAPEHTAKRKHGKSPLLKQVLYHKPDKNKQKKWLFHLSLTSNYSFSFLSKGSTAYYSHPITDPMYKKADIRWKEEKSVPLLNKQCDVVILMKTM